MNIQRISLITWALLAGAGSLAAADAVYQNDGTISSTDFTQIDATVFINNGTFTGVSPDDLAYETQDTLYYTNRGTMTAAPGFRFSYGTSSNRQPAAVFNNQGNIEAVDSGGGGVILIGGGGSFIQPTVSRLVIEATNIVNRGLLSAGQNGLISLKGQNLDLSRGGIRTGVSPSGFSGFDFSGIINTNYHINPAGVYDNYWGTGTNQVLGNPAFGTLLSLQQSTSGFDTNVLYQVPEPHSPNFQVLYSGFTTLGGFGQSTRVPVVSPSPSNVFKAFVKTNYNAGSTNILVQVVYVNTNIGNGTISADVKWRGQIPYVRLSYTEFDPVIEADISSSIYVSDDMIANTNITYTTNLITGTGRPNNYNVTRNVLWTDPTLTTSATPFNYANLIYGRAQQLAFVTNIYTGYSFLINEAPGASGLTFIQGGIFGNLLTTFLGYDYGYGFGFGALNDATNQPGRVYIDTPGTFDARYARLRGEQYLSVKAANFLSNSNTILNSPVISMDLTSTSGTLGLTNIIPATVARFNGQINMYSAMWTNYQQISALNTNTISILTHVWIVDDTAISASAPVEVRNVSLKGDNVVLDNNISVTRSLLIDSTNVTINSTLGVNGITDNADNITPATFPTLQNFTITPKGSVVVANDSTFGTTNNPINSFVNNGTFFAYSADINAHTFTSGGIFGTGGNLSGGGPVFIKADTIDMEFGTFLIGGDLTLSGQNLLSGLSSVRVGDINTTFGNQEYVSLGSLTLNISGNIDDGGAGANNNWRVTDGFHLLRLPASGDFQGTTLTSRAGKFREIHHTWAGHDLGAVAAGYVNNGAIGKLVLSGARLPLFVFDTIDGNNAIYVNYLELDNEATNVQQNLVIMPGMKIYFDQSNLPVDQLNGLFADANAPQGRLIHVANPNSSALTIAVQDGVAGGVTEAVLNSMVIDSDGDGIPNALDPTPFDGVAIQVKLLSGDKPATEISWKGAARTEYSVQYRSALGSSGWESLTNVVTGGAATPIAVQDPVGATEQRYYRVVYSP